MIPLIAVNIAIIGMVVMIHYECLHQISGLLPKLHIQHRLRILTGVVLALLAHSLEVSIFAVALYLMHHSATWGHLQGNFDGSLADCIYFSFTSYSTLGTGDIEPFGDLRFLVGLESLTGLVMITWGASFLYLEMTRYWGSE